MTTEASKTQKLVLVGEAFRPAAPVDDLELFAGREGQRGEVIIAGPQNREGTHLHSLSTDIYSLSLHDALPIFVLVGEAFRPAAPVDDLELFAGRERQRGEVISAVTQVGYHVGLYGERGVGKTSLAGVRAAIFNQPGGRHV